MTVEFDPARYDDVDYRRVGASGLRLARVSLGLWQNFGDERDAERQRAIIRRAFESGVTHFDLANNYGTPAGSAESSFGRHLKEILQGHRDEIVISTKAGYRMSPGPYGDGGSRKYLLSSLDRSLERLGIGEVDIFYSHRPDPETPLEETMLALDTAVRQGKALYAGLSNYPAELTGRALGILRELGTPVIAHQPSYSMLDRWVERGGPPLLDTLDEHGIGAIVFSPLAQGILTDRYLAGVPTDSRAAQKGTLPKERLDDATLAAVRELNSVAQARGETLAQLALGWVLRRRTVVSAIVGASSVAQLDSSLGVLDAPPLEDEVLARIETVLARREETH